MTGATFALVLVLHAGGNAGYSVVVSGFRTLAACNQYGKTLYTRLATWQRADIYECVELK